MGRSETPGLASLWRELEHLLGNPNWDGDAVNPVVQAMAPATGRAPAEELAAVAGAMARFLRSAPAQEAGIVALCAGTVVEKGGPPDDLYAALLARLPGVLAAAGRFAQAALAAFEPPEDEQEPPPQALWVGSIPVPLEWRRAFAGRDAEAVGAYNALPYWCLPVISIATRHRRLLTDLVRREDVRAAVAPLADVSGPAHFLLTLTLVPLDEPLLFVHGPSRRAFALVMDGVPTNFALHTLLAAALAAALGHEPPPAEVLRCLRGQGPGSCRVPSQGTWNLYTWKAAARPLDQLDGAPPEDWVWNEGRPADVAPFEGTRLVLAGPETIERTWNTQRTFEALPADVRLERELSETEARALLCRLEEAARP
jgi:hypothetical protein